MPSLAQYGALPLHHAAREQAGLEVVKVLLKACPDAASTPDKVLYVVQCVHVCFMSSLIAYTFLLLVFDECFFLHIEYYTYTHTFTCLHKYIPLSSRTFTCVVVCVLHDCICKCMCIYSKRANVHSKRAQYWCTHKYSYVFLDG